MEGSKAKRGLSDVNGETLNNRQRGSDGKPTKGEIESNEAGENYLEFEDPFGDEFEEEQLDEENEHHFDDEDGDDDEENYNDNMDEKNENKKPSKSVKSAVDNENHAPKQVWRPGIDQIAEGEALEYDPSAYVMYHSLQTEWPCLSFDILKDDLGESRQRVRKISDWQDTYSLVLPSLPFLIFDFENLRTVSSHNVRCERKSGRQS
jgi:Histone-binding protein RBBP4 or subunit C of CAF1 complex